MLGGMVGHPQQLPYVSHVPSIIIAVADKRLQSYSSLTAHECPYVQISGSFSVKTTDYLCVVTEVFWTEEIHCGCLCPAWVIEGLPASLCAVCYAHVVNKCVREVTKCQPLACTT